MVTSYNDLASGGNDLCFEASGAAIKYLDNVYLYQGFLSHVAAIVHSLLSNLRPYGGRACQLMTINRYLDRNALLALQRKYYMLYTTNRNQNTSSTRLLSLLLQIHMQISGNRN